MAKSSALGIGVSSRLLSSWREWFAPELQPFPLDRIQDGDLPAGVGCRAEPSAELRDTFFMYGGDWVWLAQQEFESLPIRVRRRLLVDREALGRVGQLPKETRAHCENHRTDSRVVWWPPLVRTVGYTPIIDYVEEGVGPSRHAQLSTATWDRAENVVPRARELAGTYAPGSGPNCFGTVMAAAGEDGAESVWMLQQPFEEWLGANATPCSRRDADDSPGTILVWRDATGLAAHAAITVGGGCALNKPSQSWASPRLIWPVRETISHSRQPGNRLVRYRLAA